MLVRVDMPILHDTENIAPEPEGLTLEVTFLPEFLDLRISDSGRVVRVAWEDWLRVAQLVALEYSPTQGE